MGWAGVGRRFPASLPSSVLTGFLKRSHYSGLVGTDRNKSRKAAQPGARTRSPGAGRGPCARRLPVAHACHTVTVGRPPLCTRVCTTGEGSQGPRTHTLHRRATPGHPRHRAASGEAVALGRERGLPGARAQAARASEFLRETGKLSFYVKYPDFKCWLKMLKIL